MSESNEFIKIQKSGCYGFCVPGEYIIYDTMIVTYIQYSRFSKRDKKLVLKSFKKTFKLSENEFKMIKDAIIQSKFMKYKDQYTEPTYDRQRCAITINFNNVMKKINISIGDKLVPESLTKLMHTIDSIIDSHIKIN